MGSIPFGHIGILQIENERYGFRPMEIYTEYGHAPIMKGEFLPDVFEASNLRVKAVEYLERNNLGRRAVPQIKNVIFNDPATVVMWSDGTKTVVKCQPGDVYSKETGLALCIAKKFLGNKGNFNEVFKKWIPEETEPVKELSVDEMRGALSIFCETKFSCIKCPLESPICRCGCGTHFTVKKRDRSYDMTDDEIRAAYKVAFE